MQKLLLAYDGSEPSRRALALAAEMTRRFGAALTVVSVVPVHPGRSPIDPWDDSTVHAEELIEARRLLREEGIEPKLVESAGNVPETIERFAFRPRFFAALEEILPDSDFKFFFREFSSPAITYWHDTGHAESLSTLGFLSSQTELLEALIERFSQHEVTSKYSAPRMFSCSMRGGAFGVCARGERRNVWRAR